MDSLTNNPLQEEGRALYKPNPCVLVIFGATGDLTARKLLPAIYNLGVDGLLPSHFATVGFARREKPHDQFREEVKTAINQFSRNKPVDLNFWDLFSQSFFYHRSEFDQDSGYENLAKLLQEIDQKHGTSGNRIFYLATQPKFFPIIVEKLHQHGLIYPFATTTDRWSRVIIEKPFGKDFSSATALQQKLEQFLHEKQTFRIDHYLGKETVQNLLVFRFGNALFESLWNSKHIDHIQITVAEEIGIGDRGEFFEEEGLLRDIVQNHMMQLLSLVAMEPPISLQSDAIRDEKVKILKSIRPFSKEDLQHKVVRAQYAQGLVAGEKVKSYREEEEVSSTSIVETYVALKLFIDNWRWEGVPFYLRGAKRMPKRTTEISIHFKEAPKVLFDKGVEPNILVIRIQPNEGISLKINCKIPGPASLIQPVKMDFQYGTYFGKAPPEAYERLIWDCMLGDSTLFARGDEVQGSWAILTPILDFWKEHPLQSIPEYSAGTWGPKEADNLLIEDKRKWRVL